MTNWTGWYNPAGPLYIILTKNKNEKILRSIDFYSYDTPPQNDIDTDQNGKTCIHLTEYNFTLDRLIRFYNGIPTLYIKFID